jgi:hypothetical protein
MILKSDMQYKKEYRIQKTENKMQDTGVRIQNKMNSMGSSPFYLFFVVWVMNYPIMVGRCRSPTFL